MLDRIALITGNAGKAAEYAAMLGIDVTPAKAELTELQSLDVAVVATRKVTDAYTQLGEPGTACPAPSSPGSSTPSAPRAS
jgi:XTP/dITP diphosphohydrolase